jgi:hypothetical protein
MTTAELRVEALSIILRPTAHRAMGLPLKKCCDPAHRNVRSSIPSAHHCVRFGWLEIDPFIESYDRDQLPVTKSLTRAVGGMLYVVWLPFGSQVQLNRGHRGARKEPHGGCPSHLDFKFCQRTPERRTAVVFSCVLSGRADLNSSEPAFGDG